MMLASIAHTADMGASRYARKVLISGDSKIHIFRVRRPVTHHPFVAIVIFGYPLSRLLKDAIEDP